MRRIMRGTVGLAAVLLASATASACPLCDSGTGGQVRAGLFGVDFGYHLVVTLLPFPIFLAIVAWIYAGPPWPAETPPRSTPHDGDGGAFQGKPLEGRGQRGQ